MKVQLFAALAAVMLILGVAERLGNPDFRQWLAGGRIDQGGSSIDTRLPPRPLRTEGQPGTFISTPRAAPGLRGNDLVADDDDPQLNPADRAWQQGWREVIERLGGQERTMLFELLYLAERRQRLVADRQPAAAELVSYVGQLWEGYQSAGFQSVADLPVDQRDEWVSALGQVELRWIAEVQPALVSLAESRTPSDAERVALASLQATLDGLVLARVRDDTLFLRPDERECWLRLEARVQDTPSADLRQQSVGEIGYTQLFQQPAQYRGQVVTIRGTVMYAYRAAATANYLGVTERYVLWIMPAGGPSSPIVVYALGLPAGFPSIEPPADGRLAKIRQDVTVTGFFLKRGAYQATDGPRTAPLVIANVPEWNPAPAEPDGNTRYGLGPSWLWPTVGAALAVAAIVVGLLYWLTVRNERQGRAATSPKLESADFRGVIVGPSTSESLRQLEDNQRNQSP